MRAWLGAAKARQGPQQEGDKPGRSTILGVKVGLNAVGGANTIPERSQRLGDQEGSESHPWQHSKKSHFLSILLKEGIYVLLVKLKGKFKVAKDW